MLWGSIIIKKMENHCNLQQSKKLKELGFNLPTDHYFLNDDPVFKTGVLKEYNEYLSFAACPSFKVAFNWLFDFKIKKIDSEILNNLS